MEGEGSCLDHFRVGTVKTIFYIPNFITENEHLQLLNNIYGAPASKWKSLSNRKLQNWGGVVHPKGLIPQDLPAWLTKVSERIFQESGLFPSPINHVLINEYLPNQGIMQHQDGPAYYPVATILSLGSPVVMDFVPHSRISSFANVSGCSDEGSGSCYPYSVLLMPRSLLIFKDKAYSDYLHGIKDCTVHRYDEAVNAMEALQNNEVDVDDLDLAMKTIHRSRNRVSLTCRSVLKVHKNLFKF